MAKVRNKDKNLTKNELSFPSIITIDPFSSTSYKYERGQLSSVVLGKSIKKNDFYISYMSSKELISGVVELGANISEEDVKDAIEIKAYEDLGLDTSINYKFNYSPVSASNGDQASGLYNIFALNTASIDTTFEKVGKKIPYVDYIAVTPFLIKSLYKKNILDPSGNECFIFFQKNDAFLAIYQDGEYAYSKSLKYSLYEICEKLSSTLGERVMEESFYEMLATEGLKPVDMQYQQLFMKVFSEVFLYINDVAVFARRSSGINQIDRVYIGSELGTINGMSEYVKSYMGTDAKEFNFGFKHGETNTQINQIHLLLTLTAQSYLESGSTDESLNFTIYRKPPPLSKRPAGKFLSVVAAAVILSMLYPCYQFSYGGYKYFQYTRANNELSILAPKVQQLKSISDSLQADKDQITKELNEENTVLNARKALLREIHNKRVYYPMKAEALVDLIKMVNENGVKLEGISQEDKNIILSLIGNDEKKFTELMDQIANTNRYSIRTKEIVKDDEKRLYKSDVTMEIL